VRAGDVHLAARQQIERVAARRSANTTDRRWVFARAARIAKAGAQPAHSSVSRAPRTSSSGVTRASPRFGRPDTRLGRERERVLVGAQRWATSGRRSTRGFTRASSAGRVAS
jgi:hypothetical protein